MAIIVNGYEHRTLSQPLYVNGKQVMEAYANGVKVYPEGERMYVMRVSTCGDYTVDDKRYRELGTHYIYTIEDVGHLSAHVEYSVDIACNKEFAKKTTEAGLVLEFQPDTITRLFNLSLSVELNTTYSSEGNTDPNAGWVNEYITDLGLARAMSRSVTDSGPTDIYPGNLIYVYPNEWTERLGVPGRDRTFIPAKFVPFGLYLLVKTRGLFYSSTHAAHFDGLTIRYNDSYYHEESEIWKGETIYDSDFNARQYELDIPIGEAVPLGWRYV